MTSNKLTELVKRICFTIITSTTTAGSGHTTSSLSAVELTSVLFFGGFFKQDISNFNNVLNDKFILSKGHAAPLLYSLYEAAGVLSHKEMLTLRKFNSPLQGHPTPQLPFVDVATGSLGQGLSVGLGMALGIRLKIKELGLTPKKEPTVWVLLGDSEMAEGQVWEAMEIASYYNVNNLVGIVDINRLGQSGETDLAWDVETYKKRIGTFGWHVLEIKNGHNIEEIQKIFEKANGLNTVRTQKPIMILARTVKGKGVPFLEDKLGWHGIPVPKDRLQEALDAIGPYDKKIKGVIASPPVVDLTLQNKTNQVLKRLNFIIGGTSKESAPCVIPASSKGRLTSGQKAGIQTMISNTKMSHLRLDPCLRRDDKQEEMLQVTSYKLQEKIATREAFGDALSDLGTSNNQVVALDAEVGNSTYTERLKKTNPAHFFQMFIDEGNMISVGLGLSKMGYVPFISTFAAFFTRAFDQIRMSQYSTNDQRPTTINIIGSHCGVSIGADGASQMGLEDIAMMRSIRESTVLYPSDAVSTYKITQTLASRTGINYLRTTRAKTPILYEEKEEFPIGGLKIHFCSSNTSSSHSRVVQRAIDLWSKGGNPEDNHTIENHRLDPLLRGDDTKINALIVAAGITLHEALKAQKILAKKKIYTIVVDLYSVKPLDSKTLLELAKKTKHIVVVEDHYEAGGIGEAVASVILGTPTLRRRTPGSSNDSGQARMTFTHLCVRKEPRSGTPEELLRYEEIDAEAIIKTIV